MKNNRYEDAHFLCVINVIAAGSTGKICDYISEVFTASVSEGTQVKKEAHNSIECDRSLNYVRYS
jgi:hypothetical protein